MITHLYVKIKIALRITAFMFIAPTFVIFSQERTTVK